MAFVENVVKNLSLDVVKVFLKTKLKWKEVHFLWKFLQFWAGDLGKCIPWWSMSFFVGDFIVDLTDEAVNDVVVFTLLHIPKDNQLAVRTAKIIFHLMHQCAV